jgi:hypothetical protein
VGVVLFWVRKNAPKRGTLARIGTQDLDFQLLSWCAFDTVAVQFT